MKDCFKEGTKRLRDLQQPFRPNPGEGPEAKDLNIDQIYVNAVIHEGREDYDFPTDRWEQLKVYPTPNPSQSRSVRPEDIFDTEHTNVLVVGRPGIGKTMLSTKLLRMWASDNPQMKTHFEMAFLLKFRHLNSRTDLNLYELLARAETFTEELLDDKVWSYIKANPTKVLLIFDGIDEFSARSDIAQDDSCYKNTGEKMPLYCLYRKLVSGKLLRGSSVITTTRPTALKCVRELNFSRTVEILGFTSEQIEDYVEKFTEDDDHAKQTIWQHISTNINLFSLCYIPVNCFIICHCLLHLIKISIFDGALKLPTKMTEIYSMTVKIFFHKHNRDEKCSSSKTDLGTYMYKTFKQLQPENEMVFKRLGKIAFNGIKQGRLTFESKEVDGLEDCGLLHRLPDAKSRSLSEKPKAQYCFLHLTVQEFFAAKHLTDTMTEEELRRFVADHINEGAWQVVIQFVAGLLEPHPDREIPGVDIFSKLLPLSTEEGLFEIPELKERRKATVWPAPNDRKLAVKLCNCLYEINVKQQSALQNKLAEIGFNVVNFNSCSLAPIECAAVLHALKSVNGELHLRLSGNHFGALGCVEIGLALRDVNFKVTKLTLDLNDIRDQGASHLCDALKNVNCTLTMLDLGANDIGQQGAAHLCDALKDGNCKLTMLILNNNQIGVQGAAHLSDALKGGNCNLTSLNLCANYIGEQGAAHLSDALKGGNCNLTSLGLSSNNIGDQGAAHLSDALKGGNCNLTSLGLSDNNIGEQGAAHLSDALKGGNCNLTNLNLTDNNIGEQGAAHLSDALKGGNCNLTNLNLTDNNIGEQGAAHLSDALKGGNCNLTSLGLSSNNIGDQGAAHLSDALKGGNCNLTSLGLSSNNIGEQGAAHLSDALKGENCNLTNLNLSDNNIGEQGAAHLSDALKGGNCNLTNLNLTDNNIGEQGAAHLSDALKGGNCNLTSLDLANNNIGEQGAAHLSDALKGGNCNLTNLNLSDNNIGEQGAAHLSDALKGGNCNLTSLDLSYNNIGEQGAAHLSDALKGGNCNLACWDLWL